MKESIDMVRLDKLPTEQRNPNTGCIDRLPTLEMVRLINDEDKKVAFAVERELPRIAEAVDAIYEALKAGGRLTTRRGTSGRLGHTGRGGVPADVFDGA